MTNLFSAMQQPSQGGPSRAIEPSQGGQWPGQASSVHGHDILDGEVGSTQITDTLSSMSELDRFGLAGLLHTIRSENTDIAALAIGQELTTLGLDLSQPE